MNKIMRTAFLIASSVTLSTLHAQTTEHSPAKVPAPNETEVATAVFAGGCFWCMESEFEKLEGVITVTSGFCGGSKEDATYKKVSSGRTKHLESIEVKYNPEQISYDKLLTAFWHNIDPTQNDGQFCDKGPQYRSAIFYLDAEQKQLAERSKKELEKNFDKVYTEIVEAGSFYPAEDYHQDYYIKNPKHYHQYRTGCGRDARLDKLWGDKARKAE